MHRDSFLFAAGLRYPLVELRSCLHRDLKYKTLSIACQGYISWLNTRPGGGGFHSKNEEKNKEIGGGNIENAGQNMCP